MGRERQAKWDANHLRTASTKLTIAEYQLLQEACSVDGHSVYSLLGWMIREYLTEYKEQKEQHTAAGWLYLPLPGTR